MRPLSPAPIAAGLLLLVGCAKPDKPPPKGTLSLQAAAAQAEGQGEILAQVGDTTITRSDFELRLNQQTPFARNRLNSPERKQGFLDDLIRFELLSHAAREKGYGDHPDVVLARKQAMVRAFMAEELRDLVKVTDVTDEEIAAYYEAHRADYTRPEQVRAAHIFIAEGEGAEAKARALLADLQREIAAAPKQGSDEARAIFARYARDHSDDPLTKATGGDLKHFTAPGEPRPPRGLIDRPVPPAVAQAAHELVAVGDVALTHSAAGWHIVQKTGVRKGHTRTLDDVKASIRNKLFRIRKSKAMDDYVADLRAKAKIEVDEAVLRSVEAKAVAPSGPGLRPPRFDPATLDPALTPPPPGVQAFDPRTRAPAPPAPKGAPR